MPGRVSLPYFLDPSSLRLPDALELLSCRQLGQGYKEGYPTASTLHSKARLGGYWAPSAPQRLGCGRYQLKSLQTWPPAPALGFCLHAHRVPTCSPSRSLLLAWILVSVSPCLLPFRWIIILSSPQGQGWNRHRHVSSSQSQQIKYVLTRHSAATSRVQSWSPHKLCGLFQVTQLLCA